MPTAHPRIGYLNGKLFEPAEGKSMLDDMKVAVHPYAVADGVTENINDFFGEQVMSREDADRLAAHAEMIYANNPDFKKKMRGRASREYLWSFMQHWASGLLLEEKPQYGRRLPQSFMSGGVPLHGHVKKNPSATKRRRR